MTKLFPNYNRAPIEFVRGAGSYLFDVNEKKYLDFSSGIGVMNLGYNHPKLNKVLTEQAELLWHTPNLYENSLQEKVAAQLIRSTDYRAFFCNSGAEANEAAIKLARKATGKHQIITFTNSFHGRTYGAMSATGQASIHSGFTPLVPTFDYVPFNEIAPLTAMISENTAAVMLEVIQGEGGVIPAQLDWLQQVAALCKQHKLLLIIDEVQTGMGRTGHFFGYEAYGIEPDIVTLAKALGNGLPVGVMLGKTQLAHSFGPGSHGTTFGGNKLAMSVASEVISEINKPDFLKEVTRKGQLLKHELTKVAKEVSTIKEIRGTGLMWGLELTSKEKQQQVVGDARKNGLIVLTAGGTVIRLLPPLTISEAELLRGIDLLKISLLEGETNE